MSFIRSIATGAFQSDGAYVEIDNVPAPQSVGSNPGLIGVEGTATDGKFNTPQLFSQTTDGIAIFGPILAGSKTSLLRAASNAMPEGSAFAGVRIGDGSQSAATIALLDGNNPAGIVGSFVPNTEGTNGNGAQARIDLISGTIIVSPNYLITLSYPGANPETYQVAGYAAVGGAYSAAAFQTNVAAAINSVSQRWFYIPGSSVAVPLTGAVFAASGGSDGDANITSATFVGTDGMGSSRTGAYAFRGTRIRFLICAGNTDPTIAQTLLALSRSETPPFFVGYSAPTGTDTPGMIALQSANSLIDPLLLVYVDQEQVYDQSSNSKIFVPASEKGIGIISSLSPYQDPSNKPYTGAVGIIGTERTLLGTPISKAEKGQRQQNGITWLSNSNDGAGGLWKLPHGLASDGSNISDSRMQIEVGLAVGDILGPFVGELQGSDAYDDTAPQGVRKRLKDKLDAYGGGLTPPANSGLPRQLQAFQSVCDLTINTPLSISQGFLKAIVYGTTLTGVKFALGVVVIGNQVQITDPASAIAIAA